MNNNDLKVFFNVLYYVSFWGADLFIGGYGGGCRRAGFETGIQAVE